MCGAELKEPKRQLASLPLPGGEGNLLLLVALIAAAVVIWLWKPWESGQPLAIAQPFSTPSVTPSPRPTYEIAPTATPLYSPTPPPTATLPPNQTRHIVKSGETVTSIAKLYGTTRSAVLKANGLKETSIIHVNDELIIPLPVANTPTPTPTPLPSPTPFEYTVRTADTLSEIARKFGTTVEALMEANGITDATSLRVGAKIIIVQPPDFSATMAYESHEVEAGETLIGISRKYNVTVAEIREANNLKNDTLRVGQELRIPVGTATPTPTLTLEPTLTPTPGPPYPAPYLLSPAEGLTFEGPDSVILLSWASVGILQADEWYAVRLRRSGVIAKQPSLVWTKATSWRLTPDLYVPGLAEPQRFTWQVMIMRQNGVAEDGSWVGERISVAGESRTFYWQ